MNLASSWEFYLMLLVPFNRLLLPCIVEGCQNNEERGEGAFDC